MATKIKLKQIEDGTPGQLIQANGSGVPTWVAQSSINLSGFTNDSGFVTPSSAAAFTNKTGNISQWTNDSGYALTSGTLAQFAATTSAQLASIISDETGSGSLVFGTSPTFTSSVTINAGTTSTGFYLETDATGAQLPFIINANAGCNADIVLQGVTNSRLVLKNSTSGQRWFVGNDVSNDKFYISASTNPALAFMSWSVNGAQTHLVNSHTSGAITNYTFTNSNHTGQTAATAIKGWDYGAFTRTWANAGGTNTIAEQDENVWGAVTYSISGGGSLTFTNAHGNVFNKPTASGVTITNPWAAKFNGATKTFIGTSGASLTFPASAGTSMLVESNTTNYITFLQPNANVGGIIWGAPADGFGALARWGGTQNKMEIGTASASGTVEILAGNAVVVGTFSETGLSIPGSGSDILTVTGSGDGGQRSGIRVNSTNAAGQATNYMFNNRQSTASYAGQLYGSQSNVTGNLFGVSRADKYFVFADGASNLGMAVGTLSAQPLILGTNNTNVIQLESGGNIGINGQSYGSGAKVIYIGNGTAPSSNPSSGGILYVESGALKFKGSGGTITTIANA